MIETKIIQSPNGVKLRFHHYRALTEAGSAPNLLEIERQSHQGCEM